MITKKNVITYAEKIISGNRAAFEKTPPACIWNSLIDLCFADIRAQAEFVFRDGVLTDSAEHKNKKLFLITEYLREMFK